MTPGPLAFVSMPGLTAVAAGIGLLGAAALASVAALALAAGGALRRGLRPAAAGTAVATVLLAVAGAALVAAGERAQHGGWADPAALVAAPFALAAAIVAGRKVRGALRARARPDAAEAAPPR